MKIGVVGSGNMGRSLGLLLAEQGHEVLFGSRDGAQGEAAAKLAGERGKAGTNDDAARFAEVVIWGVRGVAAAEVISDTGLLAGKIVIDMNNNETRTDGGVGPRDRSLGEILQEQLPGARVVKAFNTLPMEVFELAPAPLVDFGVSVFLASDDAEAKTQVAGLAKALGFVPVDMGELRFSRMLEGLGDVIRVAIGAGHPSTVTISLQDLPAPASQRLGGRQESKLK